MNLHTEGWLKVTKAKDKKEFMKVWTEQVNSIYCLAYSLPPDKVQDLDEQLKELKQYVKIAGDFVYGVDITETDAFKVCQQEGHDTGTGGSVCLRCGMNLVEVV